MFLKYTLFFFSIFFVSNARFFPLSFMCWISLFRSSMDYTVRSAVHFSSAKSAQNETRTLAFSPAGIYCVSPAWLAGRYIIFLLSSDIDLHLLFKLAFTLTINHGQVTHPKTHIQNSYTWLRFPLWCIYITITNRTHLTTIILLEINQ